jgi:GNAT superfamily N-acetyltransferase
LTIATDDSSNHTNIRLANLEDSERIAALCHQLGYPTSTAMIKQRLHQLQQDERHVVYVAEHPDMRVVGWVHVYVCQLLLTDLQAEIGGLVVDEGDRRYGTGQLLMQYAEQWAYRQGCKAVLVRSNMVRRTAHSFYEKIGYSKIKTSLVFHKVL